MTETATKPEKFVDPCSLLSPEKFHNLKEKLAEIPDSEFDVSTVQEPDLQQFTEQQIEDYCRKSLNPDWASGEAKILLDKSVQIIRQLRQRAVTAYGRSLGPIARGY